MQIHVSVTETVEYSHTFTVPDGFTNDPEQATAEAEEMILDLAREEVDQLAVPEREVQVTPAEG